MGDEREREEDDDAGDREEQQRREHARDVEPVARLDDAIGEARTGAGGARRDLGDHGADQRQPARNPQSAEHERQRRRQFEISQRLHSRGAVKLKQSGQIAIHRIQTERGVGQHRKESDDPGTDNDRGLLR